MSDANYTQLAYKKEVTFGVTPPSSNFKILRITGEDLSHAKEVIRSEEIRSDRQISDLVKVGASASGGFEFELSQQEIQPWLLAAFGQVAWTIFTATVTATASAAAQTLVTTGAGFAAIPAGGFVKITGLTANASNGIKRVVSKSVDNNTLYLAAGSITAAQVGATVTVAGKDARNGLDKIFHTLERRILAPDDAFYYQAYKGMAVDELNIEIASRQIITGSLKFLGKVGSVSLNSLNDLNGAYGTGAFTFGATDPVPGTLWTIGTRNYTLVAALTTAADEILIDGTPSVMAENVRNAVAAESATYGITHRALTANTQVTANDDSGAVVNVTSVLIGAAANSIATTTTVAGGAGSWGAATLTGGVNPDAFLETTESPIMNGTSNAGQVYQGRTLATERFKMLGISIKNNLRSKDAIGEEGAFEIGYGSIDVSGSIECYFKNNDFYKALINHDYSGIAIVLTDSDGASLAFTMPKVNFAAGDPNATGINTDIMLKTEYTAIRDPDLGCTIIASAFDA